MNGNFATTASVSARRADLTLATMTIKAETIFEAMTAADAVMASWRRRGMTQCYAEFALSDSGEVAP